MSAVMSAKVAKATAGSLGYPSKMPGTAYGIPATACKVGAKLHLQSSTVCSDCYALKGNYTFPSVAIAQAKRLAAIENPRWVDAMVTMLRRAHGLDGRKPHASVTDPGYHRWHDAGDTQSRAHITAICAVAERTPEIAHWIPSKELAMWLDYVATGGIIPPNLTVRLSAYNLDAAPTSRWPLTSSVYDKAPPRINAHICPAYTQGGKCGSCRACWSRDVAEVAYPKH
jgi:hypothetical protein